MVSLNAAKQRVRRVSQIRQSRNMKEKLILGDGGDGGVAGGGGDGINGLQPDGSPSPGPPRPPAAAGDSTSAARPHSFTNKLNLVTVEVNRDPTPGPSSSSFNGDGSTLNESFGEMSMVSEPASEPSTPGAHSANDIRLKEVKTPVV